MSEPSPLSPRDPREVGGYRLLRKIGGGGQGTVYLGTDGGDPVAVKVLDTDFDDTGRLKQALNRELASAQSVAAFVTAQVLAFDLDADPPYIVTEFVDGPTLDDDVRAGRGPLRGSRLADLAIQTALALEAIHAAGVIHCDFKPGNIMLGPGGVKVIDFGIARAWDSIYQAASRVIGSAHFMAPEQVDNRPLGPPVDVFSWGSVMVFAATGRYAFPGANPVAVGLRVVQDEPDLHGMTGPLADLVRACLHKDPERRPTAAQIRQALMAPAQRTLVMPEDTPEPAPAPAPAPVPGRRRGRTGRVLVALLLLALVGAGAGWAWRQWDRGGSPTGGSSTAPDPNLVALQQFATPRPLDGCVPIPPNERQLARRSCSDAGAVATYSLYRTTPVDERAEERKRVVRIHNGSPTGLRRGTGTSADGRRGEYIEYVYQAGDDKKWYAAIWWDDGIDNPGGSAVLTMRRPWTDRDDPDPARELRDRWLSWGYRLPG
jgi:predicted Ser/Thr protein kinase